MPNDLSIGLGLITVLERISRCEFFLGNHAESEQLMLQRNTVISKIVYSPDQIDLREMQSTGDWTWPSCIWKLADWTMQRVSC